MILLLIFMFFFFMFLGIPIAFSIGMSSLIYILIMGFPLEVAVQQMFSMTQSFPLLAIPFFIFMGQLAVHGGLANRILKFSNTLVGHFPGSLGLVSVVANMIMAGMSGSSVADAAAIGSVLIPSMKKEGYDERFTTALNATASTLGVIIPPSIPMVVFGWLTEVSVGRLFLGGATPGVIIGGTMFVYTIWIALQRRYPRAAKRATVKELLIAFKESFLALIVPILIIFCIVAGVATPSEVAVAGAVYVLFVSAILYRELTPRGLYVSLKESAISTVVVMAIVCTSGLFSWLLAYEKIPTLLIDGILSFTTNKIVILLIINIMLLIAGCIIDLVPNLLLFVPILFPLAMQVGIDPVHFGVIVVVNLAIGLYTPPVGTTLFVSCNIAKISIEKIIKDLFPFFIMGMIVLFFISYFPVVVLWLPNLLFK